MLARRPTQPIRIGEFLLDPGLNELRRGAEVQRLPARLADLLLRLAEDAGRGVSRDTLIDAVWERRQVNDEVLSRAIADLRQFLGDDARAPRYIETLPKLGYRLVAVVVEADAERAARATTAAERAAAPAPAPRSVARPLPALLALLIASAGAWWWFGPRTATPAPTIVDTEARGDPLTSANLLRARPFTTEAGRELFPRFTPDARWVIYTRASTDTTPAVLRLRAVDGTEDRALVEDGNDNVCGTVSPDGATLAWLRARPGVCELVYRDLLGGPARVLAGCQPSSPASCPSWSPDGRQLVLAGNAESAGLVEVAFPSGELRTLTTPSPGTHDLMPRYARNGDLIFWHGDAWGRNLQTWSRATGATRVLRAAAHLAFGHAVASDGTLLLADDSFGQRALVRWDREQATTLLGGTDARYPDIGRDGALVYEIARYDANLWRIDLRDPKAAPQRLTASARYDSQPAYSPDGQWLAFGSNRDGREGVYLMRADGRDERKLPLDPALRWTSPVWTLDGARLMVLRYDVDASQYCEHDLATSRTTCRPELGRDQHGAFFLDADTLAMIDAQSERSGLTRADLVTGQVDDAGVGEVDRCAASERWLVCHRPGVPGLWREHRRSGERRTFLPELGDERGAWALSGDVIYYALRRDAQRAPGIYRHELGREGADVFVHGLMPTAIGVTLAVAPDLSALVVARTDGVETDLMYVPPPSQGPASDTASTPP